MIKVTRLKKNFGKSVILNDVSLEIEDASIIGVVGRNGSGKTTLFRCLLNICQIENGNIENRSKRRKVIFDLAPKLKGFTVRQYLKYFILLYDEKNDNQNRMDIDSILAIINLACFQHKKVSELSFGMKKLLYISTLLIGRTEFAVIDEPFNGLDEKSRNIVKNILLNLKEKYNATIMVSSHQHEQLSDICDCYLKIENGDVCYIPFSNNNVSFEISFNDNADILEYYKNEFVDEADMEELDYMKIVLGKCLLRNPEKFNLRCIEKNAKEPRNEFF